MKQGRVLKLQRLFDGGAQPDEGSAVFDFSGRDFGGFTVPGPARAAWRAVPAGGAVDLTLDVDAEISGVCARCLVDVVRPWPIHKVYRISPADLLEEFPELPYTPEGNLDMDELAFGEILLEVDPVLLCSESCEGLCPHCGKPKRDCTCEEQPAQPQGDLRLQVLRGLLQDDES